MTESWEFEKDHKNIEKDIENTRKTMEGNLKDKKERILQKLFEKKIKVVFKIQSPGLKIDTIEVEGVLTTVNPAYIFLKNPEPNIWKEEYAMITLNDIRSIKTI